MNEAGAGERVKIVYVGELMPGTTSAMRRDSLVQLGHDVTSVDSALGSNYVIKRESLLGRIKARLVDVTGGSRRMCRALLMAVRRHRPQVVFIDKGILIDAETLREVKAIEPGVTVAHFNPDDPFGIGASFRTWHRFVDAIPEYDVHFVPRKQNIDEYKSKGARSVIFQLPSRGFDPRVHRQYDLAGEGAGIFRSEISFVGGAEEQRTASIEALLADGIQVTLWGDVWLRRMKQPRVLLRPSVFGADYGKALSGSDISLGFLRKANRDGHTSRSIEIPACGAMLLAERTDDHLELFEEGQEAEFFGSDDELRDKAKYYLQNKMARRRIALAGLARCVADKYSYVSLMRERLRLTLAMESR